jgi:glycerol-3-phosphate cytidylyltransferase
MRGICFGAFDPLHIGHIFLFQNAKAQCDELIVSVSTDDRIFRVKGYKAKFSLFDRMRAIREISCVDLVIPQETKTEAIERYKPDIIFVGDDWKGKEWDGANLGVKVVYLPRTEGVSSTDLR